ncbi:hypothetical protein AB3X52_13405 [Nocardioides sp. DS6]|uniref:DUF3515 family protein n=1 Tax=Nocardioides eburneus TaxID=3231482 RepID=A0ABV3T0A6_9ACTN
MDDPTLGNGAGMDRRVLVVSVAVAAVAIAAGLLVRHVADKQDWSAVAPVAPVTSPVPKVCKTLGARVAPDCAAADKRERDDVPTDPIKLIRYGEADPSLLCVLGQETLADVDVEGRVTALTADQVGSPRRCLLVVDSGDHTYLVGLWASRDPLQATTDRKVAGHPAWRGPDPLDDYSVALTEPSERGTLGIDFGLNEPTWGQDFLTAYVKRAFGA